MSPAGKVAMRAIRDCGAIGTRTTERRPVLDALAYQGLALCRTKRHAGEWWKVYTLTDAGRSAIASAAE